MARVTVAEVQAIIDYDSTVITDITPFITAANAFVTQALGSSGLGDDLLKEIERWMAAHLIAIRDQRVVREKIGEAEVNYQHDEGLYLNLTHYGSTAVSLDTTGTLRGIVENGSSVQPDLEAWA